MRKSLLIAFLFLLSFSARAADMTVTESKNQFSSTAITIRSGNTVTFDNKDEVVHNLQVVDSHGDADDKGIQRPGQQIRQTFIKPGEYKVRCTLQPDMQMKVIVQ